MTSSKVLFFLSLSFILGIFTASFFQISLALLFILICFGILFFFISFWRRNLIILGFCLLFFLFGIFRYQSAFSESEKSKLKQFNGISDNLLIIGYIIKEPEFSQKSQHLVVQAKNIFFKDRALECDEKMLVILSPILEYEYGQKLKIEGKISLPADNIDGFNYKNYLKKDGIYTVMIFPKVEVLEEKIRPSLKSFIYGKILKLKSRLRTSISQNISYPQRLILNAMLLGDKKGISENLADKLNITGLRHLTAISGLHVTILSSILLSLFLGLGFWRQQAIVFSLIFIILFVLLTGLQPSAVRAGIMGGIFILAQYFGKAYASSRAVSFAAFLMLLQNPLLLKYDIGFQLSFLAITGIIFFSPILENFFRKIPNPFQFKNILILTISAQIFTLPLLLFNFGYFSLIAPITNILVLPVLPLILGSGFLFAFLGLFSQKLGQIFSLPCWFLLTYLLKIVDFFSQSWAAKVFNISWQWLILSYLFLGMITWRLSERQKLRFLRY